MLLNCLFKRAGANTFSLIFVTIFFNCVEIQFLHAQGLQGDALRDSLLQSVPKEKNDTIKAKALYRLSRIYAVSDSATAFKYADECLNLSKKNNWQKGIGLAYLAKGVAFENLTNYTSSIKYSTAAYEIFKSLDIKKNAAAALVNIGNCYEGVGYYTKAINNDLAALKIFESISDTSNMGVCYNNIGVNYYHLAEYDKAIYYYKKSLPIYIKAADDFGIGSALDNIAITFLDEEKYDSANMYDLEAIPYFKRSGNLPGLGRIYDNRGNILLSLNNADSAYYYYQQAFAIDKSLNISDALASNYGNFGELYLDVASDSSKKYLIASFMKKSKIILLDSAKYYLTKALAADKQEGDLESSMNHYQLLSETNEKLGNYSDALTNHKLYTLYKDSIFNDENKKKIEAMETERLTEEKNNEIQILNKENALQFARSKLIYSILGMAVLAVIIIALIQYRSNKHKQKINLALQHQKEKVESTLIELESTQQQLIQSEKMASLGELTAGIAHEIQNPLNFVNNFSEVNKEMLEELKAERLKPNADKTIEDNLIIDLIDNSEKINHHGKRADAIVKGMLQHSRQSSGKKEPTDINALCDEYLRLSYHGLRAKEKDFNAGFKTDFDESIGKINIVSQDIGRVLLNLINNAFYAVNEKQKAESKTQNAAYKPQVSIQTQKLNNNIEIIVADNGNGIPQNIIDKIFQPFFTTKPTGQGTGLGLSLAYDIITKEHNGTIKVESKEGEGSTFIIQLAI